MTGDNSSVCCHVLAPPYCISDSQRLNPAQSVDRAPARQTVRDPRGQLLSAALVCWLSAYLNVAGGEAPQPKMVIPASFAQAQVSADGKRVVLVAAATSRAEDLSQSQMPGELRIVDLETGRTIATRPVPQAFLGVAPEWRRSVTPDARHYGWLDNDRWLVVSRVVDGEEVHRVDLNAISTPRAVTCPCLTCRTCMCGIWPTYLL